MNAESLHIESIYPFSYVCARTLERKCIRSVSDKNYRWLWWKKGFSQIPKLITLSNFPNFMLPCLCRLVFPGWGHGETRRLIQNQTMSLAPTKWHTSSMCCQSQGWCVLCWPVIAGSSPLSYPSWQAGSTIEEHIRASMIHLYLWMSILFIMILNQKLILWIKIPNSNHSKIETMNWFLILWIMNHADPSAH